MVDVKVRMSWANITPNTKKYVQNVLNRGWLSYSLYQPRFEQSVADLHGAKHGIFVNSGTDALTISLSALKEIHKWPNQAEVIVPALTFVATINAVIHAGLKPVFADVESTTANLDWNSYHDRISRKTVCVVPVHLFGLPVEIPKISHKVVEDSCETFGVHKIRGDFQCFSFYMSHHISAGVGGMMLTNNARCAQIARSLMNHGRIDDGSHFQFGRSGYSSRATEMEAAVGLAALEHFQADLVKRRALADEYLNGLCTISSIRMAEHSPDHSWMFYPVRLIDGNRDKLLKHLRFNGIESREAMPLVNQPVFRELYKKGSCPNAEDWTKNGLLLPLHPLMTAKDVDYVCDKVRRFFA